MKNRQISISYQLKCIFEINLEGSKTFVSLTYLKKKRGGNIILSESETKKADCPLPVTCSLTLLEYIK